MYKYLNSDLRKSPVKKDPIYTNELGEPSENTDGEMNDLKSPLLFPYRFGV